MSSFEHQPIDGLRYREVLPDPRLADFINCFWLLEAPCSAMVDTVFPDGCLELVFYLDGMSERVHLEDGTSESNPRLELTGQMTRPYGIRWPVSARLVGVQFYPHTFACFAPRELGIASCNDQAMEAADVLGPAFRTVSTRLEECCDPMEALALLQTYFLDQLPRVASGFSSHSYLAFAIPYILRQPGTMCLDDLLSKLGIGRRRLEYLFSRSLGISPKYFCRMMRFQQAFQWLRVEPRLVAVATACGYHDQAHFIRDFRHFTGTTPSVFVRAAGPISTTFLNVDTYSYLYNFRG